MRGAVQESLHVFLQAGLDFRIGRGAKTIDILEMGFGTGLNALLTAIAAAERFVPVHYTTLERYPLSASEAGMLNYPQLLGHENWFQQLHASPWEEDIRVNEHFVLHKAHTGLLDYTPQKFFDVIYYDAFAPSAQPELWTQPVFHKLYDCLHPGGILVTYCSKGDVRRAMAAAGFTVGKLPGPPGKREMVRAEKGGRTEEQVSKEQMKY